MATFAPDILSALSGAPGDRGARNVRETSLNSTGSRRGFSSVLRSVRGEVGRATIREAEDARPVNQTDDGSHAKETKGLNGSTQQERSHASSRTTEGTGTSSNDDKLAADTRTGDESSTRQDDVRSGPQDQAPVPISSLISVPAQPQVVDQAEVQNETEQHVIGDEAGLDTSSQHPLISHESIDPLRATPEAIGGRSSLTNADAASPPPVSKDSIPGSPLSPQDPNIPLQVVQAHIGKTSLDGKVLVANDEAPKHEGGLVDHSVSSQAAQHMHALGDYDALGARTEQSFSHGRQFGNEGSEQFDELWSGHNGRQMEDGEPKIHQPFVVDHTIANGSVAESAVPGAPRHGMSTNGTPAATSFGPHVTPGLHAEDATQSAGVSVMRSVVVNVAQPDLGQVNIRVAMTNDVVHTHFSSDRLEVGQFIVNGQDRLQAALQASGLDMGQFRVDIDRQGAGRSFQQGSSQEQGQPWNQGSPEMKQDTQQEKQDGTRRSSHGLLSLVA